MAGTTAIRPTTKHIGKSIIARVCETGSAFPEISADSGIIRVKSMIFAPKMTNISVYLMMRTLMHIWKRLP